MTNTGKFTAIVLTLSLLATASTAQKSGQDIVTSSSDNIVQGEPSQNTLIERITDSLSLTASNNLVGPSDTITFDAEVRPNFPASDVSNIRKVIEIYRCDNGDCSDPNTFIESDSEVADFDSYVSSTPRSWTVDYNVPSETGQYEAVAYIFDTETSSVVSTTSVENFEIVRATFPDSNRDPEIYDNSDEPSGETDEQQNSNQLNVEKRLSTTPYFSVDQESNTVTANIVISNFGSDDMPQPDIVEMQVRPGTSLPLSFSGEQRTCDPEYPNNVHKEYQINSGDAETIKLSAGQDLKDGEQYTVYFLTRSSCGGDRTEPIPNSLEGGSFTLDSSEDSSEITDNEYDSQDVTDVGTPRLSLNDGTISTTVTFKNQGADMPDSDIVEMQVRPQGANPLSFSSTQTVCDRSTPENVNREYQLASGEQATTTLSTNSVDRGQKYTVYLLTRQGCADEVDGENKVDPYYNSLRVGTVDLTGGNGSVDLPSSNMIQILLIVSGLIVLAGGVFVSLR